MDANKPTEQRKNQTLHGVRSSFGLIWSLMDGFAIALLACLPVLSFAYYRTLLQAWPHLTIFDLLTFAYNPSRGFPLIWFVCPIITMILLARIWKMRDDYNVASRMRSRTRIWLAQVSDIAAVSALCAIIIHLSLLAIGAIFIGVPSNVGDPVSIGAQFTGGQTLDKFSFSGAAALMLIYAFLALVVSNSLFFLLHSVLKTIPAFFITVVLGYPEVHNSSAFVHDIVSTYGGSLNAVNPLSYLYETASVFYPSWLPGASHALWFLVVATVIFLGLGWVRVGRKEFR